MIGSKFISFAAQSEKLAPLIGCYSEVTQEFLIVRSQGWRVLIVDDLVHTWTSVDYRKRLMPPDTADVNSQFADAEKYSTNDHRPLLGFTLRSARDLNVSGHLPHPRSCSRHNYCICFGSKYLFVQVLPIAGLQWFAWYYPEGPSPIGVPFGTQEQGTVRPPVKEAVCKVI